MAKAKGCRVPPSLAKACVRSLQWDLRGDWVLDPACGEGAFVAAIMEAGARVEALDADPTAPGLDVAKFSHHGRCFLRHSGRWDAIIGCPPPRMGRPYTERALGMADGVALLMPLSLLVGRGLWSDIPPAEVLVVPHLVGGARLALYVWDGSAEAHPRLGWVPWAP